MYQNINEVAAGQNVIVNTFITNTRHFRAQVKVYKGKTTEILVPPIVTSNGGNEWKKFPKGIVKDQILNSVSRLCFRLINEYTTVVPVTAEFQDRISSIFNSAYQEVQPSTGVFEAVKCCVCGKIHPADSTDYLTFMGNVMVGKEGGVIGNNLDDNFKVNRYTYVCRTEACTNKILLGGL